MNNKTQTSASSVALLLLFIFGLALFAFGLSVFGFAVFNFIQSLSDKSGLSGMAGVVTLIISLGIMSLGWKMSRHYYSKYHQTTTESQDQSTAISQEASQSSHKSGIFFD